MQCSYHGKTFIKRIGADPNIEGADLLQIMRRVQKNTNLWTKDEQEKFITAMRIHGKNWAKIAEFVGTRDQQQCRSHRQKFVQRIKADPTIVGADLL